MSEATNRSCYNFRCDKCIFASENEKAFDDHYKTHHKNEAVHFCRECGHVFSILSDMIDHIKTDCSKVEDRILRCGVSPCTFTTTSPFKFIEHSKLVHRNTNLMPCVNCAKLFTYPAFLVKHIQIECATPVRVKNVKGSSCKNEGSDVKKPLVKFEVKPIPKIELKPTIKCDIKPTFNYNPKSIPKLPENTGSTEPCASTSKISESACISIEEKKRKNSEPDAELLPKVAKRSKNNWRILNPFAGNDGDSDPDDPTWEPSISTRVRGFNDRRAASQTKSYAEDSFSSDSSMEDESENCNDPEPINEIQDPPETVAAPSCESSPEIIEEHVADGTENVVESREIDSLPIPPPLEKFSPAKRQEWSHWRSEIIAHKSFEAFDSLQEKDSLLNFFKCMSYHCKFTTDDEQSFANHQLLEHWNPAIITQLPCVYCLEKFDCGRPLVQHIIEAHGRRIYQCSLCLYRACTKRHIKNHFKSVHKGAGAMLLLTGKIYGRKTDNQCVSVTKDDVVLSYVCTVPDCLYKTEFLDHFVSHNQNCHADAQTYSCSYCRQEFDAVEPLMKHLESHGLGLHQCAYCIFGAEDINEIVLHQCLKHADFELEAYRRRDDDLPEITTQNREDTQEDAYPLPLDLSKKLVEPSAASSGRNAATVTRQMEVIPDEEVTVIGQVAMEPVLGDKGYLLISNIKIEAEEPVTEVEEPKTNEIAAVFSDGNLSNINSTPSGSNGTNGCESDARFLINKVQIKSEYLIETRTAAVSLSDPPPKKMATVAVQPMKILETVTVQPVKRDLSPTPKQTVKMETKIKIMKQKDLPVEFPCDKCTFTTDDEEKFVDHLSNLHRKEIAVFCRKCGHVFFSILDLVLHLKTACTQFKSVLLKCSVSLCTFTTMDTLEFTEHVKYFHRGTSLFPCWNCVRLFTIPAYLIEHMQNECPFKTVSRDDPQPETVRKQEVRTEDLSKLPAREVPKIPTRSQDVVNTTNMNLRKRPEATKAKARDEEDIVLSNNADDDDNCSYSGNENGTAGFSADDNETDNSDSNGLFLEESSTESGSTKSGRSSRKWKKSEVERENNENCEKQVIGKKKVPSRKGKGNRRRSARKGKGGKKYPKNSEKHNIYDETKDSPSADENTELAKKETSKNVRKTRLQSLSESQIFTRPEDDVAASSALASIPSYSGISSHKANAIENTQVPTASSSTQEDSSNVEKVPEPNKKPFIPIKAVACPMSKKRPVFKTWNEWLLRTISRKYHTSLETLHERKESLQHFFTCMSYTCTFTTDDVLLFLQHQVHEHPNKKLPCLYCFEEFEAGKQLTEHTISAHSSRVYQCSRCLYRASNSAQVKLHFQALHDETEPPVFYKCDMISPGDSSPAPERGEVVLPYVCQVNRCTFKTDLPSEFIVHNKNCHYNVSAYPCSYCKSELETMEALIRHLTSHGLYNFQCGYCIFGSDIINDVYVHQCLNHADYECKAYIRPLDAQKDGEAAQSSEAQNGSFYREKWVPEYVVDCRSRFSCIFNNCGSVLDSVSAYGEHVATVHSMNRFPCPHCTELFLSAYSFESHLSMHGPTLYMCTELECGFLHHSKESLKNHCMEIHKREAHDIRTFRDESPQTSNETEQSKPNDIPVLQHCMVDSTGTGTGLDEDNSESSTSTVHTMPDVLVDESSEPYFDSYSPAHEEAVDEEGVSWYRKELPKINLSKVTVITTRSLKLGIKLSYADFIKLSGMGRKKLVVKVVDMKNDMIF